MSAGSDAVRAFAPASVSNLACGFDVLGFAIEGAGDVVTARRRRGSGVVIEAIEGAEGIPVDRERNTAGVAARSLLERAFPGGDAPGIGLAIAKGMPAGTGLGSSAASAVAAVLAVDGLLGLESATDRLLDAALGGEAIVSGAVHGDNVAPALLGGLILVRLDRSPRTVPLPVPEGLTCALLCPALVVETGPSRGKIGPEVPLGVARGHWGDTAALVAGLFRGDRALIASALNDRVAEPVRHGAVPRYFEVKEAAISAGALGAGLSGSGPSVFALCPDAATACRAGEAMADAFRPAGVEATVRISPVGAPGGRLLADGETPCTS